ncbi:tetratricopeptide repeat protein [Winogradskyella sp. A3E31]|uniref:tetratricopeptide repeat protein n=1 Tax=Winogradskyella sp. A3E31 TaxID=3349637 RepID=UPI00398A6E34
MENDNLNFDELIDGKLFERLSTLDEERFNKLMESNDEFVKEFNERRLLQHTIITEEDEVLKSYLKKLEIEQQKPKYLKRALFTSAAVLLVLIGIYFYDTIYNSNANLYSRYYGTPENVITPITRGVTENDILKDAFIKYQEGDYASTQLKLINAYDQSNQSELLFYIAITHLELKNYDEAIKAFKDHIKHNDALAEDSLWYLSLAYIVNDQPNLAIAHLETIAKDQDNPRSSSADKLLKRLP